ncbi:MAG: hypothetical protein HY898_18155 [Deltaproteobacteria bacterium]|nr:hypothetical protein [Deltaproteobacteria bacterium]
MTSSLFAQLTELLGRRIDDAELLAFIDRLGSKPPKSATDNDSTTYVIAKKHGLELGFSHIVHDRSKYPPRKEARRWVTYFTCAWLRDRFPGPLPEGLDGKLTRDELERRFGAPIWTMYSDEDGLPARERFLVASTETWNLTCEWSRRQGSVSNLHVALNEARDLGYDDLAVGMFAAWAAHRVGLGKRHVGSDAAKALIEKKTTGRRFVKDACGGVLWSDDIAPELTDFAFQYCHRAMGSETWRQAVGAADGVRLGEDFEASFPDCSPDFELVPDTWDAWERFAPLLDARWADFQATRFRAPPPAELYVQARKAQEKVMKATGKLTPPPPVRASAPSDLTDRLTALIGKPTTDAAVATLSRELGLRLPKKHEDVADPERGFWIDYHKQSGTKKFVVRGITFLPEGRHTVRFAGELRFAAYAGPLPCGVALDDTLGSLTAKLGKPADAEEDYAEWVFDKEQRRLLIWFEQGKIRSVCWLDGRPID